MFSLAYPAQFEPDETGRPVVSFPDFPHAHTDGRDTAEAMEEAIDCLGSVIAQRLADKAEIPVPSPLKRGERLLPVPLWIAGKLALHFAMKEEALSNVALASRLAVSETVVRRMLDPGHATKSKKLEAALGTLGRQLVIGMDEVRLPKNSKTRFGKRSGVKLKKSA
jgi:antitoxin HicB